MGSAFGILLVLFGFMLGFLDLVPRVMSCVFNHFWVISTVWSFSGLFRTLGGRLPLGKVASFGTPARGRKSKGLVLLDAEQALILSFYQIVKERMAGCEVKLLIL